MAIVRKNFGWRICVCELAALVGFSVIAFERRFRKCSHMQRPVGEREVRGGLSDEARSATVADAPP